MNRLSALLLAMLFCAGCAPLPASPGSDTPKDSAQSLEPFYAALAELEAHRRERVAVLQIGDSHTANDSFSGRLRDLMQARFGNGGRGMLPPGIPYRYYKPTQVHVTSEGWTPYRSSVDSFGAFGWTGLQQRGGAGAEMTLQADAPGLARVNIEALGQPGGGTLDIVTSTGSTQALSTENPRPVPILFRLQPGANATDVRVRARGDGPVTLLSWRAEQAQAGVTWSNLGTIGATVDLVLHWDPALMAAEAVAFRPDLVVLAFGTNEGFSNVTSMADYPSRYGAVLHKLKEAAPKAALLALGPPGGVRATRGEGDCIAQGRSGWAIPVNLPRIRDIEQTVAARESVSFWDWSAAMGGDCAIVPWAETDPPLAAHDHVHLLKPGYERTADALFATLMAGYEQYRQRR